MVLDTLTLSAECPTSSLDTLTSVISTWFDPDERRSTLTVGGDYALPPETEDADDELRAWVKGARRSVARWARENPY